MPVIFATQSACLLRLILLSLFVLTLTQHVSGQAAADSIMAAASDSLPVPDTPTIVNDSLPFVHSVDSVSRIPWLYANWEIDPGKPLLVQVLQRHPYFGFGSQPAVIRTGLRQFEGKEILFYGLIGLLIAFALLRLAFPKYFNDLFRLFFRTTLKQKQVREQLMQTPVPSLLLNFFFVISGGLYIDILLQHYGIAPVDNFWLLFLYCALGLSIIYTVKFLGLKISGWLFNMKEGGDTYIFVVFIINKVIGIFLLPFLVLLSFLQGNMYTIAMVLSWCGIGMLLIYRFLLTYASVRNQVRFNPFHFFLYLCAFEIAPLLLIYKALLFFFR
jgi:Domain of unknown function (DUF4271)